MRARRAKQREVLLEAFTAGWQAALAVEITNPRVLAVVESCFELWLEEATGEVDVLGLAFRGREDLPMPDARHVPAWLAPSPPRPRGRPAEQPARRPIEELRPLELLAGLRDRSRRDVPGPAVVVPEQRIHPDRSKREQRSPARTERV